MVAERIGGVEANKGKRIVGRMFIDSGGAESVTTAVHHHSGHIGRTCVPMLELVQKWSLTGARVSKCAGDVLCRRDTVQKCWPGGTSHTKESNRCSHDLILASLHALVPLHWSIRIRRKIYQSSP